jgi:chromosome segregation ATPase
METPTQLAEANKQIAYLKEQNKQTKLELNLIKKKLETTEKQNRFLNTQYEKIEKAFKEFTKELHQIRGTTINNSDRIQSLGSNISDLNRKLHTKSNT